MATVVAREAICCLRAVISASKLAGAVDFVKVDGYNDVVDTGTVDAVDREAAGSVLVGSGDWVDIFLRGFLSGGGCVKSGN